MLDIVIQQDLTLMSQGQFLKDVKEFIYLLENWLLTPSDLSQV